MSEMRFHSFGRAILFERWCPSFPSGRRVYPYILLSWKIFDYVEKSAHLDFLFYELASITSGLPGFRS